MKSTEKHQQLVGSGKLSAGKTIGSSSIKIVLPTSEAQNRGFIVWRFHPELPKKHMHLDRLISCLD